MLQRAIAGVIAVRLVLAPWAGADDSPARPGPIAAAASREAARPAPGPRGALPGGLKWTGISLLAVGGAILPVARYGDCTPSDFACRDQRAAGYVAGGLLAGTGALLLVIAHHKRSPAIPSLVIDGQRAVVQQRIRF
jgi:hypothetical protein